MAIKETVRKIEIWTTKRPEFIRFIVRYSSGRVTNDEILKGDKSTRLRLTRGQTPNTVIDDQT